MTLSDADYVHSGGSVCPACGSEDIQGVSIVGGDDAVVKGAIICKSCESMWTDIYKLTGYERLMSSTEIRKIKVPEDLSEAFEQLKKLQELQEEKP